MVRFSKPDDNEYKKISGYLQVWADEAPGAIRKRSVKQKNRYEDMLY